MSKIPSPISPNHVPQLEPWEMAVTHPGLTDRCFVSSAAAVTPAAPPRIIVPQAACALPSLASAPYQ